MMMRMVPVSLVMVMMGIVRFPAGASAQVEHRVDLRAPGSNGRALDLNPQVQGGRLNQGRVAPFDGGLRARALTTGNLTGLARFHGPTPVLQSNSFRTTLPSSGLSRFLSTSVGVSEIRSHQALRPTLYLGREETIADVGFIRRGLNRPGSSTLISPRLRPPLVTSPRDYPQGFELPSRIESRLDAAADPADRGRIRRSLIVPPQRAADGPLSAPFSSAVGSSIFGPPPSTTPTAQASPQLYGNRRQPERGLSGALDRPVLTRIELDELASGTDPGKVESRATLADSLSLNPLTTGQATSGRPLLARRGGRVWSSGLTAGRRMVPLADPARDSGGLRPAPLVPGEDRFADLVEAVNVVQQLGVRRLGLLGRSGAPTGGMAPQGADVQLPPVRRPTDEALPALPEVFPTEGTVDSVADLAVAAKWAQDLMDDPVRTFAGRHRNRLNTYLLEAEDALHRGEYYDAARRYDLAHMVDPRNPLPLLGRGHALTAAGDYLSGVNALRRGLERFPQIAAFRLDLPSMVGRHDIFDIRRADLAERLSRIEDHELRFLLGYLELYSGLEREGLRDLQTAASAARPGSIIAIFPDLVLGRRELPRLDGSDR